MTERLISLFSDIFSFEGTFEVFVGQFDRPTLALSSRSLRSPVNLGFLSDTLALVLFLLSHELAEHSNFVRPVLSKIKTKALGGANLQQVVIE